MNDSAGSDIVPDETSRRAAMKNLLLDEIQYKIDETPLGVWRRFLYPDGQLFEAHLGQGVPQLAEWSRP